jgi:hypothetical protein
MEDFHCKYKKETVESITALPAYIYLVKIWKINNHSYQWNVFL